MVEVAKHLEHRNSSIKGSLTYSHKPIQTHEKYKYS